MHTAEVKTLQPASCTLCNFHFVLYTLGTYVANCSPITATCLLHSLLFFDTLWHVAFVQSLQPASNTLCTLCFSFDFHWYTLTLTCSFFPITATCRVNSLHSLQFRFQSGLPLLHCVECCSAVSLPRPPLLHCVHCLANIQRSVKRIKMHNWRKKLKRGESLRTKAHVVKVCSSRRYRTKNNLNIL